MDDPAHAAKELNTAFSKILTTHGDKYKELVVGVFNGKQATLTDKYDIRRGINRGKHHDVVDLTQRVHVYPRVLQKPRPHLTAQPLVSPQLP